ncbi:hypothetical protein GE09DRAFT_1180965 [Coniochaeta sp. 2T2.1]|nr:hypothetical protein GE09DRAFT_1180965 [Coniochaeta sp. 2T2.1]
MAVIEDLGLSVTVHIDGADTVEYEDPEPSQDKKFPEARVVSHYIQSEDDKEYQIHCQVLRQHSWLSEADGRVLSVHAYTDGHWRSGQIYDRRKSKDFVLSIDGTMDTPPGASYSTLSKFKFDAVTTVDAADVETIKTDSAAAVSLGTIRIEVWCGLEQGACLPPARTDKQAKLSLAEKALKGKAVSHGTSLAAPINVTPITFSKIEKLYGKPYAIFFFKYRSRDALRKEMIVTRTPSPGPAPEGVEGLNQEELQRLAAERLAQIKTEKKPVIKREFDVMYDLTGEDADDPPRPVKMPRRHKEPETIDLTDD